MFMILAASLLGCGTSTPAPTDAAEQPTDGEKVAKGKKGKGKKGKGKAGKAPEVDKIPAKVFFVDSKALAEGTEPVLVAVDREIGAKTPPRNALWMLFQGPTAEEKERGLTLVASGADGFEELVIADGVASLKLRGGCEGGGATTTVFDEIHATLTAFDDVQHVKVYDAAGQTMSPEGSADSRPACLEP